jgi:raffinose/stachyose/melibiose transport system substrate-binding protein
MRLICLLIFGLLVLLIPASAAAQDKVQLEIWFYDDELGQCLSDMYTSGFNSYSETAQVRVTLQADAYTIIGTALSGGGGPDVVPADGIVQGMEFSRAGLLLPLDKYLEQYNLDEQFVPWALDLGKSGGAVYILPDSLETLVFWYNKTLFEEHGWQVPTTMAEFLALLQTIADANIVPIANGFGDYPPAHEWLVAAFLNHYAGADKVYEALTGQRPWTDPAFLEAITTLNQIVQDGWIAGGVDKFFTDSFPTAHAMVGDGEAAMTLEGSWFFPTNYFGPAAGNNNEFDWFPIPSSDGQEQFMTGLGAAWGINANSKHPDEAAQLLAWMFSPEVQAQRLVECGFALAPIEISSDAFSGTDPRVAAIYSRYGEAAAQGNYGYLTWTFFPPGLQSNLYEQIQRVYLGEITPEAYLEGAQAAFDKDVADNNVPPIPPR